jgi:hypothetical protein
VTTSAPIFDQIKNIPNTPDGTFETALLLVDKQVVYPNLLSPLMISGETNRLAIREALKQRSTVVICQLHDDKSPTALLERIFTIGTEVADWRFYGRARSQFQYSGTGTAPRRSVGHPTNNALHQG